MCKCVNISVGSYDRQTLMKVPFAPEEKKHGGLVAIDTCLVQEIAELWFLGIDTIECCCGHNQLPGYILVDELYIKKMRSLGYKNRNLCKYDTDQVFLPKTEWRSSTSGELVNFLIRRINLKQAK